MLIAYSPKGGVFVGHPSPSTPCASSDTDQSAIRETAFLASIPDMADRLRSASTAPDDDFIDAREVDL